MDLTYRTELRELNDLNFARFDAKVGERLAELREDMNTRFTDRLAKLRDELSDSIRETKVSILRWMFAFWIGTALAILGSRLVQ